MAKTEQGDRVVQDSIWVKTEAGQLALQERGRCPELTGRLRNLLLQVDGKRNGAELGALATSLGCPDGVLARLAELGLATPMPLADTPPSMADEAPAAVLDVAPDTATVDKDAAFKRFLAATEMMNKAVSQYLGLKAVFFTLKIERCNNAMELKALLDELHKAIAKAKTPFIADRVTEDIREVLQ